MEVEKKKGKQIKSSKTMLVNKNNLSKNKNNSKLHIEPKDTDPLVTDSESVSPNSKNNTATRFQPIKEQDEISNTSNKGSDRRKS